MIEDEGEDGTREDEEELEHSCVFCGYGDDQSRLTHYEARGYGTGIAAHSDYYLCIFCEGHTTASSFVIGSVREHADLEQNIIHCFHVLLDTLKPKGA